MEYLGDGDVAAFRKYATSKDALEGLLHASPCQHFKYVSASRFLVQRASKIESSEVFRPTVVRVVECAKEGSSAWWKAIWPGTGVVLVEPADITELPCSMVFTDDYPSINHLTIANVGEESKNLSEALLRALPCPVESVQFTDIDDHHLHVDDWITPFLIACPGLKKLDTSRGCCVSSLKSIVDGAVEGKVKLEALRIRSPTPLRERLVGVIPFLTTFTNPDHPLTRQLRELELTVTNEDPDGFDYDFDYDDWYDQLSDHELVPTLVSTVHQMLTVNRRLHKVTFHFEDFDEIPITWPDEQVAIWTAPLALRSKLALLSALDNQATSKAADTAVLSIIFQFAAEHRIRRIIIN